MLGREFQLEAEEVLQRKNENNLTTDGTEGHRENLFQGEQLARLGLDRHDDFKPKKRKSAASMSDAARHFLRDLCASVPLW